MSQATYSRKATFIATKTKNGRVFTAVNARAHTVCRKAGKRTHVTLQELKALRGKGTYKFYQYTEDGSLKLIRF